MKKGFAGALAALALALASVGLGATSYSDPAGDDNAAPDITSITVADGSPDTVTLTVVVANHPELFANSWLNLWFDLDENRDTGVVGYDALVRYLPSGGIEYLLWNGSTLIPQAATALAATFEAGVLTMTLPKTVLGSAPTLGILVVSGRRQQLGAGSFIASDFAPNTGSYAWSRTDQAVFTDPEGDHEAAPDVTSVRVSDTKDGWIRFAITTRNRELLLEQEIVGLYVDTDGRLGTGNNGAEIVIPHIAGEVLLQRWDAAARRWVLDDPPTLLRSRNANHLLTIDVHRSEFGNAQRFRFRLVSVAFDPGTGTESAVDLAPDNGSYWRYELANLPALRLLAGKSIAAPAPPGRPLTISAPVRRSDTNRPISSGTVACTVRASGKRVPATGRVRAGRAECTMVAPASGTKVTGSMTVRSGGAKVTARFSFRVR